MKKIFAICLLAFFSFAIFAEEAAVEPPASGTVLIPSFGVSYITTPKAQYLSQAAGVDGEGLAKDFSIKWGNLTAGLAIGTVKPSGFTFYWDNYFSFFGTVKTGLTPNAGYSFNQPDNEIKFDKGVYYMTNFLFGYTFKFVSDMLFLNICTGLHMGIGATNMDIVKITSVIAAPDADLLLGSYSQATIGVPLQVGFAYYFSRHVGIEVTVCDALGYSVGAFSRFVDVDGAPDESRNVVLIPAGFSNTITARFGIAFRY